MNTTNFYFKYNNSSSAFNQSGLKKTALFPDSYFSVINTYYYIFIVLFFIVIFIIFFVAILIYTAAFTLVERKVMGLLQRREGPDKVGFEGVGQPIADGVKLVKKETLVPKDSPSRIIFIFAPIISLTISLVL